MLTSHVVGGNNLSRLDAGSLKRFTSRFGTIGLVVGAATGKDRSLAVPKKTVKRPSMALTSYFQ